MRANDTPIYIAEFVEKLWKIVPQVESVMFASLFWLCSTDDWAQGFTQVLYYWALAPAQASAVLTDDSCTWLLKQNMLPWFSWPPRD